MLKTTKIINWVCLSLGVIGIAGLFSYNPSVVGFANFFLLLPYGLALIAFRHDTRKVGVWVALALNLLYGALFAALIVLGITGKIGSPLLAITVGFLYGAGPCGLNVWLLIQKLRGATANPPLNRTRADGARAG
jgi:hypothetical protein